MWPVLCSIHLEPVIVFPVTLTLGSQRPLDLTFLEDAVTEIKQLLESGLKFDGRITGVKLRCIVCDAPAKAMVKNTKLFSAYYGCDRCEQKGIWDGRMTYQEVDGFKVRTDHSFRAQTQQEHHNGRTPLTELPVDMTGQFPIDYMHQACLGVMKKLLTIWTRGERGRSRQTMISIGQVDVVSARLIDLQKCIPSCFARKPRSLRQLERWKATELRQFLVYTGKLVLSGILRQDLYEHFLTFSVAISILLCPSLVSQHVSYAHKLLQYFVAKGRELYGPTFLVYNVHSMLHLASDAKNYGCLDECSAFPFENYMQKLKRMVRSGKSPLVQVVKRIRENQDGTTLQSIQRGNAISSKQPDNCIILEDGKCCEVIDKTENDYLCRVFLQPSPLFMEPCESSIIGAYVCQRLFRGKE
ncbi:hypothetical protein QQF64_019549 [Cirrhinus molitorella]|uniref:Transposase domain-containing protein n=1 Tax=Cirrhinus molitorella TaxID=172907 RepID=A0ABR3LFY4_9TELE